METIRGTVEKIVYKNLENQFHIFRLNLDDDDELITVKGTFMNIHPGSFLEIQGELAYSKYGEQFDAASYKENHPISKENIERYLGSGFINGIGPVFAKRIVEAFGEDTLDILEFNPGRLYEIPGIGKKKIAGIILSFEHQKEMKDIMMFLNGHGISAAYAMKIYRAYGKDSIGIVSENPYRLADDISGIGFLIADRIAQVMGFDEHSVVRTKAALTYALKERSKQGDVYLLLRELLEAGAKLIGCTLEQAEHALGALVREKRLIHEEKDGSERIYLSHLAYAENGVVLELNRLHGTLGSSVETQEIINHIIHENRVLYNDEQILAIRTAMEEKLMILTGGPGTGKTTTILGIIQALRKQNRSISLAAPTGRAAKRLSEVTGVEAKTIHRMLEYNMENGFQRNADHPLEGQVFIIDESSMMDILLVHALLAALPDKATIIFIGDIDQLPAVGPGNVLKDFIASGFIPTICLEEIFRQIKESKIVTNAHRINQKELPKVENLDEDDFFFIKEGSEEKILSLLEDLVTRRLPQKYGFDPVNDIQILVPLKKGLIGTKNINVLMQKILNPVGPSVDYGDHCFRLGDKVMQIRNDYEKKVFNGDMGRIIDVHGDEILVDFDGESVSYVQGELDGLQLGYCVTIHKSQGSEYPVVIMPLVSQHYVLLDKNLIYTGVTRAKRLLIMIATEQVLRMGINKEHVEHRNTALGIKLKELLGR